MSLENSAINTTGKIAIIGLAGRFQYIMIMMFFERLQRVAARAAKVAIINHQRIAAVSCDMFADGRHNFLRRFAGFARYILAGKFKCAIIALNHALSIFAELVYRQRIEEFIGNEQ